MESLLSRRKTNVLDPKTGKHNGFSDYPKRGERERAKEEYEKYTEHMV